LQHLFKPEPSMNKVFALMIAALIMASCSFSRPLYNVEDHPIPTAARNLPVERIGTLIIDAGHQRHWTFEEAGPGHLVATQKDRKTMAVVDIYFDQKSYRILKKSTSGLSDEDGMINRHYNSWIHYLEDDIDERLRNAAS
jgi:hypothetical protein